MYLSSGSKIEAENYLIDANYDNEESKL